LILYLRCRTSAHNINNDYYILYTCVPCLVYWYKVIHMYGHAVMAIAVGIYHAWPLKIIAPLRQCFIILCTCMCVFVFVIVSRVRARITVWKTIAVLQINDQLQMTFLLVFPRSLRLSYYILFAAFHTACWPRYLYIT